MTRARRLARGLVVAALATVAVRAAADCRIVEVSFRPAAHLQLAVWIEDPQGRFVDTAFVTRSVGALGLGNRPGNARFKSGYRWPYGRREMALPVFAHARGVTYPYIIMGGANSVDPHDDSIGYHEANSSTENFYCPPSSAGLDAVSCASQFVGCKGLIDQSRRSYYPPRADLASFGSNDSEDARGYAALNDLAAISGATPPGGALLQPAARWAVPSTTPNGSYVVKVEASLEGDFNDAHHHPSFPDYNAELRSFGRDVLGQPSVVYAVPITVDGTPHTGSTDAAIGYGDWDGASGSVHPLDGSISDGNGSGAGRLAHVSDSDGTWRVKVFAAGCAGCRAPAAATGLGASAADTAVTLTFNAPSWTDALDQPRRYEIRYQAKTPLTDANFGDGIPADMPPPPGPAGQAQSASLTGLKAETEYYIGLRAINACGQPGPATFARISTGKQRFVVLHGCFIATAAYGSPLAAEVARLRRLRDQALYASPLGRVLVATYYALSPPLAAAISVDPRLRALARAALAPAVALARAYDLSEHPRR